MLALSPHHIDLPGDVLKGQGGGVSFYLMWIRDGKGGGILLFWFILGTSGPSLQGTRFQVLKSSFSEYVGWTEGGREGWDWTSSP